MSCCGAPDSSPTSSPSIISPTSFGDPDVASRVQTDAEDRVKTMSLVRAVAMERRKSFSDRELNGQELVETPGAGVVPAAATFGGPDLHGHGLRIAQGKESAEPYMGGGTPELDTVSGVVETPGEPDSASTTTSDVGSLGQSPPVQAARGTHDTTINNTHRVSTDAVAASRAAKSSAVKQAKGERMTSPLPPKLSTAESISVDTTPYPPLHSHVPVDRRVDTVAKPGVSRRRVQSDALDIEEIDVSSEAAFQRVVISGAIGLSSEQRAACVLLRKALKMREKHVHAKPAYYWGSFQQNDFPFSPKSRTPPTYVGGQQVVDRPAASPRQTPHHPGPTPHRPGHNQLPSPSDGSLARSCITPDRIKLPGASTAMSPSLGPSLGPTLPTTATVPSSHSGELITPTLTGVVATATAASHAAHKFLHGSHLVTLETGKDYGNLFYRRRLEPAYTPFCVPMVPAVPAVHRFINGVMCVFPEATVVPPTPPGVELTPKFGSRGDSLLVHMNASDACSPHDAPTPSRDYTDTEDTEGEARYTNPDNSLFPVPSFKEYHTDYTELVRIIHSPFVKSFAYRRLELLSARFQLHTQLNAEKEMSESKAVPHRDFYNVRKVDTHVHHSACMNQKHLLNFIKAKLKNEPDVRVIIRDGKQLTLKEVFESLSLTAYDLSVDTLDMHADWSTFHRFDRFNLKYNPVGQSRLREIFLKTDNFIKGRYLAEITHEVFSDLEAAKYSFAEYRLSIYGKSRDEWRSLAAWVVDNNLASTQVRWMIQIPRLYEAYRENKSIANFQDMLNNIFLPLFEVTRDPSVDPKLHQFLGLVVGFDCVDDESKQEVLRDSEAVPPPQNWTGALQPPYYYWNYYLAANLGVLNKYRAARQMTQFSFRPHAGEAGDVDHLAATFLTAESVNHGINLKKSPALQYLYYLAQIGLAVSPLSNNKLFVEYNKNPFYDYFAKGMNVSLSTDDPLILSYTREPLIEEYCVAAQVWKLTAVDMCEIARNSVLQSGFEYPYKTHFIGPNYAERGPSGNDIHSTNVPYIRLQYRKETLDMELALLEEPPVPAPRVKTPALHPAPVDARTSSHGSGKEGSQSATFTIGPPATSAMVGSESQGAFPVRDGVLRAQMVTQLADNAHEPDAAELRRKALMSVQIAASIKAMSDAQLNEAVNNS